jgi:integrating conjugative element protein (TIGR03761 family)
MRSYAQVIATVMRMCPVIPEPVIRIDEPSPALKQTTPPATVGRLQGEAWLEIHTRQAQRLIRGRSRSGGKPAITGLLGFATQLNMVWHAASEDDPYAHWWLIRIEEAIGQAQVFLAEQVSRMGALYPGTARFQWSASHSQRPHTVLLQFATPYAYRAAQLLGEFDCLVCQCLTLKHVGACAPEQLTGVIESAAHQVRRVFSLPQGFRVFAIDRAEVRQNTQRAEQALAHFGELPAEILSGARTATFAPAQQPAGPRPVPWEIPPHATVELSDTGASADAV